MDINVSKPFKGQLRVHARMRIQRFNSQGLAESTREPAITTRGAAIVDGQSSSSSNIHPRIISLLASTTADCLPNGVTETFEPLIALPLSGHCCRHCLQQFYWPWKHQETP